MATLVDALIVELALDPAPLVKALKDAGIALDKTSTEAVRHNKRIEDASKNTAEAINKLTLRVLELYAVFLGGRGLKEFVTDLTRSDAALGRLAEQLNISPQTLSAWQRGAELVGGSAQATAQSFQAISDALQNRILTGALPEAWARVQALGGQNIANARDTQAAMLALAHNLQAIQRQFGSAEAYRLGALLNLDPATVRVMIEGGAGLEAEIEKLKRLGPTDRDIDASKRLYESWVNLQQEAWSLGRTILTDVEPYLQTIIKLMADWFDANKAWLDQKLQDVLRGLIEWLTAPATRKGFSDFAANVSAVAAALGGWKMAGEAILGLWVASKVAPVLGLLGSLALAFRTATLAASPLMAALAAAGLAYAAFTVKDSRGFTLADNIWNWSYRNTWVTARDATRADMYGAGLADAMSAPVGAKTKNWSEWARGLVGLPGKELTVTGTKVSRANPVPVVDVASGANWWERLTSGLSDALGTSNNGPSPGPSSTDRGASAPTAEGAAGYAHVYEMAKAAGDPHPEVVAGQWAIESAWGAKPSGKNNYFGQTADGVPGHWVNYDTPQAGLMDHLRRWGNKSGYRDATTAAAAIAALVAAGYTPDPGYAEAVLRAIKEGEAARAAPSAWNGGASPLGYAPPSASSAPPGAHPATRTSQSAMTIGAINFSGGEGDRGIVGTIDSNLAANFFAGMANSGPL